jgi:16S rRNA (uracil1498-N3)-methyltransferase
MNLVLIDPSELDTNNIASFGGVRARHVHQVLGAEPGRAVRIGVIDGAQGVGTVLAIEPERVRLACVFDDVPPVPRVDLLLALPRPKVLQRMWAQLAALGVGRIVLTNAARVERNYFDTHVLDEGTYRPLLIEGLQQARDTRVPLVSVHRQFRILIEDELDALCPPAVSEPGGRILLAVGPEGGWNDFERRLLASRGFTSFSLGSRTLRTDTACVALLAVVTALAFTSSS